MATYGKKRGKGVRVIFIDPFIKGLIVITTMTMKSLLTSLLRQAQDGEHAEPFSKGREITPLWQRGDRGDFTVHVNSILRPIITFYISHVIVTVPIDWIFVWGVNSLWERTATWGRKRSNNRFRCLRKIGEQTSTG